MKEKERKVVTMEALNTYKAEKTLAEQMNERLAELKMTKAEAALKMNYSRRHLANTSTGSMQVTLPNWKRRSGSSLRHPEGWKAVRHRREARQASSKRR